MREEICAPSQLHASLPVIVNRLGLHVSGTLYNDYDQSVFLLHVLLDTGASLTFMEEKILSRLGLCCDDLVPLSSVGFPRLVVADWRPMPVLGVVSSLTLSLGALPPCPVRVVVVERLCGADLILGSDFLLANGATVFFWE